MWENCDEDKAFQEFNEEMISFSNAVAAKKGRSAICELLSEDGNRNATVAFVICYIAAMGHSLCTEPIQKNDKKTILFET